MSGKTNMSEQAKGIRISGTITDKDKNPLPGVKCTCTGTDRELE